MLITHREHGPQRIPRRHPRRSSSFARKITSEVLVCRQFGCNVASHFVLPCYRPVYRKAVDPDLAVLDTPDPRLRNASLLCFGPEVKAVWSAFGTPIFTHRLCGQPLIVGNARPVTDGLEHYLSLGGH
jgi:hypothetical protein